MTRNHDRSSLPEHGLGHGVVGGVDVHPQPGERLVEISRQVVRVYVLWQINAVNFWKNLLGYLLADPGEARGCSTNTVVIH